MTRMLLLAALALACVPSVAVAGALGIGTPEHLYAYAAPLSVVFALVCCGLVIRAHVRGAVPAPEARIWLIPLAFMATMLVGPAFAQEASSSTLGIPWGQMVAEFSKAALEIILPVLSALAVAGAARLPWWVTMWLTTQRIDRMLKTGADYAINAVEGATHDKALSVNVGYPVIKTALERIMGSTPAWLVKEAGGAKGITERLFRVFKFDETVTDANTLSPLIRDLPTLPFAK